MLAQVWWIVFVMLNAKQLQQKHGELLQQPPWNTYGSAFILHKKLELNNPPIVTSIQAVKTWLQKHRIADQVSLGLRLHSKSRQFIP
jgi:hypothetical protein